MQSLPRFVSTNAEGGDEREFLFDFFKDKGDALSKIFLKGYQWPFDVRKVKGGSSVIDILVYIERGKGRRIFLDYRKNPLNEAVDFASLSAEARGYLEKGGACFGTPIERLLHMNKPAVDFYRDKGVDLEKEMLEIAISVQHNNGGIAVDCWWQSSLEGFFAAGEAAGTHGVYRPGGCALNSGQVGSTRAAQFIAARRQGALPWEENWYSQVKEQISGMLKLAAGSAGEPPASAWDAEETYNKAAVRMSRWGAAFRNAKEIAASALAAREDLAALYAKAASVPSGELASASRFSRLFRLRDMLMSQIVYLGAMEDYIRAGGGSRGSALYTDPSGENPYSGLPDMFRFKLDDGSMGKKIQEAAYSGGTCSCSWRPVRPIPEDDDFFENVWRSYRDNGNIF
jgi:hypothetical protein